MDDALFGIGPHSSWGWVFISRMSPVIGVVIQFLANMHVVVT